MRWSNRSTHMLLQVKICWTTLTQRVLSCSLRFETL
ncbi:hypothetical protein OIU74_027169 [Salix koriyanagi]|uniref:Uncharacterized protein n=1 Tax=Salix koriyanagi TaxID=2511006 RepID=A0A9Q0VZX9_9ROSI|nr:hypothetical protein OIU74_027169 [Salix koriyanagi]